MLKLQHHESKAVVKGLELLMNTFFSNDLEILEREEGAYAYGEEESYSSESSEEGHREGREQELIEI